MSQVLEYAQNLMARESITPEDAGCQDWLAGKLKDLRFINEPMQFGKVKNLWSRHGLGKPLFVFAGHTDVVPTGPQQDWVTEPFVPTIKDGFLYGRGAADMKSSIAAMLLAVEDFLQEVKEPAINLGFLITADEEGPAVEGTVKVIDALEARDEKINWCLVGEPTAVKEIGDVVKNGRRGSLNATLIVKGVQGHVAYPHLLKNPIHQASEALAELAAATWDEGNQFFPPTSMQISNINAGTGATNVTPGQMEVVFNFRFSTENTEQSLQEKTHSILDKHHLDYSIDWNLSGQPFLTETGLLLDAATSAIEKSCGLETQILTTGGTSDGRFIAPTGAQVLELGPCNESIHKVNENIKIEDLEKLVGIYKNLLHYLNTHV